MDFFLDFLSYLLSDSARTYYVQLLYQIILLIYTGYCEIENYFDIALFLCPHLCVVIVHFTSVHASKSTICSIICITMLLKKLREKGDLVFIYKVCYINLFYLPFHVLFICSFGFKLLPNVIFLCQHNFVPPLDYYYHQIYYIYTLL